MGCKPGDTQTLNFLLRWVSRLHPLLASTAEAAPPPFTLAADGRRWTLPRDRSPAELAEAAAGAVAPLPGLVTVGQAAEGRLLLNLEADGLTALVGSPADTRGLLDAIAVELATSSWSGFFELVLVGFGAELRLLERVRLVDSLQQALPELKRRIQESIGLLAELGCGSVLAGRITGHAADSWAPTVVLCATPPTPAMLERLAALTTHAPSPAFAPVVDGDTPAAPWRVEVSGGQARVVPATSRCGPSG